MLYLKYNLKKDSLDMCHSKISAYILTTAILWPSLKFATFQFLPLSDNIRISVPFDLPIINFIFDILIGSANMSDVGTSWDHGSSVILTNNNLKVTKKNTSSEMVIGK